MSIPTRLLFLVLLTLALWFPTGGDWSHWLPNVISILGACTGCALLIWAARLAREGET